MAKIGLLLKEARLKKGITLERIADDTNISVRFLSKLEADDFTGFPGEPYIVGFIRNYADFLGLRAEELVALYRGISPAEPKPIEKSDNASPADKTTAPPKDPELSKVREPQKDAQTVPIEKQKKSLPAIGVLSVAIVCVAVIWIIAGGKLLPSRNADPEKTAMEYRVESGPFEKRLYVGDSILVPIGDDVYKLSLTDIKDSVMLDTPFGAMTLSLGDSKALEAPEQSPNTAMEIVKIGVIDFMASKPAAGVLLRVEFARTELESVVKGEVTILGTPTDQQAQIPSAIKQADSVIFRSNRGPFPFVVQISFRGNSLFRYETDKKDWVEKYYVKGEAVTVNATSSITVWSSNAQAVKMTFQASGAKPFDLEIGGPGEIAVKRISWNRLENSWALVSATLD